MRSEANAARYPISAQCRMSGVPRSTYYWMTEHPETEHVDPIAGDVRAIRRDSRERYGAGKIKAALERKGVTASGMNCAPICGTLFISIQSQATGDAPRNSSGVRPPSRIWRRLVFQCTMYASSSALNRSYEPNVRSLCLCEASAVFVG